MVRCGGGPDSVNGNGGIWKRSNLTAPLWGVGWGWSLRRRAGQWMSDTSSELKVDWTGTGILVVFGRGLSLSARGEGGVSAWSCRVRWDYTTTNADFAVWKQESCGYDENDHHIFALRWGIPFGGEPVLSKIIVFKTELRICPSPQEWNAEMPSHCLCVVTAWTTRGFGVYRRNDLRTHNSSLSLTLFSVLSLIITIFKWRRRLSCPLQVRAPRTL